MNTFPCASANAATFLDACGSTVLLSISKEPFFPDLIKIHKVHREGQEVSTEQHYSYFWYKVLIYKQITQMWLHNFAIYIYVHNFDEYIQPPHETCVKILRWCHARNFQHTKKICYYQLQIHSYNYKHLWFVSHNSQMEESIWIFCM